MAKKLLVFLVLLSASSPVFSQSDEFTFHGFKGVGKNISLDGVAEIEQNGILRLTNYSSGVLGHAFYSMPFEFKNSTNGKAFSFSTAFAFAIVPEYAKLGGHGFAFTIAKSKELKGALPRQYLGLLNADDNGNFSNHLFAVEFDTVSDYDFKDISGNHVGVDINSLVSNISVNGSCFSQGNSIKQELNLQSGKLVQAWVDYDSVSNVLNVTLSLSSSKPSVPILSFPVDLSPIFLEYMYVGFSASTGLLASSHYISGWSFKINGQAQSLDLSSLPSVPRSKKNNLPLILVYCLSAAVSVALAIGIVLYKKLTTMDVIEPWELDIGPHRYSYKELKKATRGFKDNELIGFGGFGRVYKGTLPNTNAKVAVKQINNGSKQGMREFISEIETIGRLRHRNLVQLLGWCRHRNDLFLVYDFMSNGSLDKYIFYEPKLILSWELRFKIIKGVASGLLYLHEEWEQTVIHRDIKAGNVLLDSELNGRLGDFGLAKLYEHGTDPSTTKVVGTLGYLAPELTKTGKPTTSSDVFAFGALLLEIVCGRKPIEVKALPEELVLVDWVWDKWQEGSILEVVDTRLKGEYDEGEVVMVLKLGLMCSNNAPAKRPSMRQVVSFLKGEVPLQEVMVAPDEYGGKKFVSGRATSTDTDRVLHSYLESSSLEKVSSWSSVYDCKRVVDLEAGSTSTLSASFTEDE